MTNDMCPVNQVGTKQITRFIKPMYPDSETIAVDIGRCTASAVNLNNIKNHILINFYALLPVFQGGCLVVDPVVTMEILDDESVPVDGTSLYVTPDIEPITALSQVIFVRGQFTLVISITKVLDEKLGVTFCHFKITLNITL